MATTYSTQTSQSGPPDWQIPYLQQGLQYSQNLLNAGAPQYYPGQTVTPFSQATEQAMQGIQQRAQAGTPGIAQGQQYVANQLSQPVQSQFGQAQNPYASGANPFGGASNPYLDQTFQRAAQQTQGQLASEYARAGRNIQASQQPRSEQLNSLATSIYGGAYDAERNRMANYAGQQLGIGATGYENAQSRQLSDLQSQRANNLSALSAIPSLQQSGYYDWQQLANVGAAQEALTGRYQQDAQNRWNYEQQAPGANLDAYLARINGVRGGEQSSQTTPYYSSTGGNVLGGALAGAGLGGALNLGGNSNLYLAGLGGLLGLMG